MEARAIVRQAMAILTPAVPARMEDGHQMLTHWTRKIIVEEGHTVPQLVHILHLIVQHFKVGMCVAGRGGLRADADTLSGICFEVSLVFHFSAIMRLSSSFPGLPCGSEDKASACSAGDLGSIPGLGRSPGEGNGNPLQYSCLENPMDGGAWWATVHGVA